VTAVVYFLVFSLCWEYLSLNETSAISAGYMLSVSVHFFGNKYFTFEKWSGSLRVQLMKYGSMVLFNYAITLIISHIIVSEMGLSPYVAIVGSIAATVISGYFMSRNWVFNS
jgi:putative flippase GtrA